MPRYLVTSALPYANGPIHFGHVIGAYLPADVYVRTLRMLGEEAVFVCGTDEHGVAITIGAEREKSPYPEYVARWRSVIKGTFDRLGIEFDVWSGTSVSPCHVELSQAFFRSLDERGYLLQRRVEQLYCPADRMFLADRYVLGTCPKCGYPKARGDECPRCATWSDPLSFADPRCAVCGTTPERRETTHWYLDLPRLRDDGLGAWIAQHEWKPNVAAFVGNMLEHLEPRPITRDMAWGVPVPEDRAGDERGKVLYVWFDAPIGYVSFTREWAAARGEPQAWKAWWQSPGTRLVHFIGKDNISFHCVVFPAMLQGVGEGYVLPWQVPAMEFYNLQGRKFSTSEGWTIPLEEFFARYDRDATRSYLLSSAPETADSEWRWEDFQRHVNVALADTIGNLVTRVLRFVAKTCDGRVPRAHEAHVTELDRLLLEECGPLEDPAEHVRAFRFRRAIEAVIANARAGNVFVDRCAPWALRKTDPQRAESVLASACDWIGLLSLWMAPFLPQKAQALWTMLGQAGAPQARRWPGLPRAGAWRGLVPPGQALGEVGALFAKLEDDAIQAEIARLGTPPA